LTEFTDLGLAEPILRAIAAEGHDHPTPIQSQAIPLASAGRDLIGIAQTGTGKTAAFVLPMLHRLARDAARPMPKGCRALILVPTRELAAQVTESIRAYSRFMPLTCALVIGGARPGPQIRALSKGVDIVVATPGRLLDHMGSGAARLDGTGCVVLDEADHMFDLGFLPAIRRLMNALPRQRQTMLFSATMPRPIRTLAADFLTDPAEVSVAPAARPIERIDQSVLHVAAGEKGDALKRVLGQPLVGRAIVFTRTKRGADKVARSLDQAGLTALALHGNKSQSQRERTLAGFRDGRVAVLVATDIAARGIDVDGVSHVINFDLPNVPEAYVHRIGRTARAGRDGTAISLCDPAERGLLRDIEKLIGSAIKAPDGEPVIQDAGRPAASQARSRPRVANDRNAGGPPGRPRRRRRARPDNGAQAPARASA
jgi:ATP-dependent RNA helicase RhlE